MATDRYRNMGYRYVAQGLPTGERGTCLFVTQIQGNSVGGLAAGVGRREEMDRAPYVRLV